MRIFKTTRRRSPQAAFTLIELLAAILIIAVLVALLFGGGQRVIVSTEKVKCASNLRQIGAAIMAYTADNGGCLPPGSRSAGTGAGNFVNLLSGYTSPMILPTMACDIFYCPTNVRLGSPPQEGYSIPPSGHYKGFSGYWTNFLINASIFPVTNGDPSSSAFVPDGRVRYASVILPSKTVALSDMYTRLPTVTNPPVSGLASATYFDPKNTSFFLGRIHNNIGNVLFLDGHVEGFDGSNKIAAKSLPSQTTTW